MATIKWKKEQNSKVLKYILIVPAYLVIMFVTMIGFDLIFVNSNEYDKERNYIESNIYNTKIAYGIDCEDETIQYSGTINENEIKNNQNIIDNIPVISQDAVLKTLEDSQTGTGYFSYRNANLAKYRINGKIFE